MTGVMRPPKFPLSLLGLAAATITIGKSFLGLELSNVRWLEVTTLMMEVLSMLNRIWAKNAGNVLQNIAVLVRLWSGL